MKYLIRLPVKMYPAPWRERYGTEFAALLDDAGVHGESCDVHTPVAPDASAIVICRV